jgi:O-antigen ligase
MDIAVLAWLAVEMAATAFSVNPRVSLVGDVEQHEGLLTSLGLAGVYLAFRLRHGSPAQVTRTFAWWLAAAALTSVYALFQSGHMDVFAWSRTSGYGTGLTRPFGTLGHPNMLGAISAAALAAVVTLPFLPNRAWLKLLLAALFALATALTFSRGAWLAVPVSLAVAWPLAKLARGSSDGLKPPRWPVVLVAAGLVALLALGPWAAPLRARLGEIFAHGATSARMEIWRSALAAWRARPWLGQGPDALAMMFSHYQTAAYWRVEWGGLPVNAHSIPIHTLATRGVLGLLTGLGGIATAVLAARAAWRAGERQRVLVPPLIGALVAVLVAGMLNPVGIASATLLALSTASLAALAAPRPVASEPEPVVPKRARRASGAAPDPGFARVPLAWLPGAVLAVAVLAWCVVDGRGLSAARMAQGWNRRAAAFTGPARDGALREAIAWTRRATTLDPWSDLAWRDRPRPRTSVSLAATSFEASIEEAEQAAHRAVALAPLRAENYQSLGNLLLTRAQLGDERARLAGEAAFEQAIACAPMNAHILLDKARDEMKIKRPDAALATARRATWRYPDDGRALLIIGEAWAGLGREDSARAVLTRALRADWHGDTSSVVQVREQLARLP